MFQSAYRPNHSTETALVKIFNYISLSLGTGNKMVLCLLDLSAAFNSYTHSLQPHLTQTPHQHCRHPPTLTLSQHTHMQHKQQYMHHSHRNNRTHNIGYYDNLTNRPRTTTGLLTPHKHTGPGVKVREISSYCKST